MHLLVGCIEWEQKEWSNEVYAERQLRFFNTIIVGIATAYGLNGSGIESRWGWDFPHLSRPALRPTQPPVKSVPGLSRR